MFTAAQQQNTISIPAPAPVQGIVANTVFGEGSEQAFLRALWMYNVIPTEYGCRVRDGSREFVTGIPDAVSADGEVRTLMYYNSIVAGGLNDKYFAATSDGIYDITVGGAGPHTQLVDWPIKDVATAGWCSFLNFTNVAGDHYLLVCDEANGYYIYDGTAWAVGTFTGTPAPDAADLVQITEWQGRIWFVERDTARAWFLDPLALTGDITPFDVGNRFKSGGHLVQNTTWTLDDGAGMDDKFVQISSSGDVLVWSGVNPTVSADINLVGRWVVGAVPEGRRVMSDWGGDVLILSTNGAVLLTNLLNPDAPIPDDAFLTYNISRLIRQEMALTLADFGWSIGLVPQAGIAIITVPQPATVSRLPIQFVMDISTKAWCMFRGLDMVCQDKNVNGLFFGTTDGRVMSYEGTVDNVPLDASSGNAIDFSFMTHYSDAGTPGIWKRPQFLRPYWVGGSRPSFTVAMRYDFDLSETISAPVPGQLDASLWDSAVWDADTWRGTAQRYQDTVGVNGMGRHVAFAIRGETSYETSYLGADLMGDGGGLL